MAARRRPATVADLLAKPARTQDLEISVPGKGDDEKLLIKLRAVSASAYDKILADHPPTKEQEAQGQGYNPDTFAPAVIAAVVEEPKLALEDAVMIWTGEQWSRGELRDLFMACVNLCSRGLDVPFTSAG